MRKHLRNTNTNFLPDITDIYIVRTSVIAVVLCIVFFFLPLQCFIIGENLAVGIQGAVFRYQMSEGGNSLILITDELQYINRGIYSGKTAAMVIFWTLGTFVLTLITILSLVKWDRMVDRDMKIIIFGLFGASILYFASLVTQYGLFFSGSAGISLPAGILMLIIFGTFLHIYKKYFTYY